jgi:hypothetical protein
VNISIIRSGSLYREEHYLRVPENEMLCNVSGIKDKGVTGGWRTLHKEEVHNL